MMESHPSGNQKRNSFSFVFELEWCRKAILKPKTKSVTGTKLRLFIAEVNEIEQNWMNTCVQYCFNILLATVGCYISL
jgi:hypothetical protein